jgi:hypothetical protein
MFQAPQSSGAASPYGPLLLQLAAQQSAQANQTISGIGDRLLQLSEARQARAFTLQRDDAARDFQVEDRTAQQEFALKRDQAERDFQVSRELEGRSFQAALEAQRHKQGMEDIERRAELQAQAELAERQAKEAAEQESRGRIADIQRQFPNLIQSRELSRYEALPRFADPKGQTLESLTERLVEDGLSQAAAASMARDLMRRERIQYVDPNSRAAALAALERSGDQNPEQTLKGVIGDLGDLSQERRAYETHVGSTVGGRIDGVQRTRTGALDIPGAGVAPPTATALGVSVRGLGGTVASFGEELQEIYQSQGLPLDFDSALMPEAYRLDNWVFDPSTGEVRPRQGLSPDVIESMRDPNVRKAIEIISSRTSQETLRRQSSTPVPLTKTNLTEGASGPGTKTSGQAASPLTFTEDSVEATWSNLSDIGVFRTMFGAQPILPQR